MEILTDWASGQSWFQVAGEIVLWATAITAAMPTRLYKKNGTERAWYKYISKPLNWLAGNVFKNKNADDK